MMISAKKITAIFTIVSFVFMPVCGYAQGIPTDMLPQVVNPGTAAFDYSIPNQLTITDTVNDKFIAEYSSFSIGSEATVNFVQKSETSIALNRVTGGSVSEIFGALNATGIVYLINTNGVIFSPNSSLDVAGLVASTLDITDANFLSGKYEFFLNQLAGQNVGSVINRTQTLGARAGGFIALLGPRVENQENCALIADKGTVALASGDAITLSLDNNDLISVVVTDEASIDPSGTGEAGVINAGTIQAKEGKVLITADVLNTVFDNAINNSGIIEARNIYVWGDGTINIMEGSELTASGQRKNSNNYSEIFISNYGEDGDINITGSALSATLDARSPGSARVFVWTDGHLDIVDSTIASEVQGYATSISGAGDYIEDYIYTDGDSYLTNYAGSLVSLWGTEGVAIDPSVISSKVTTYDYYSGSTYLGSVGGDGSAYTWIESTGDGADISIAGNTEEKSEVTASVVNDGDAQVWIESYGNADIEIGNTDIAATVGDEGDAEVYIAADDGNVSLDVAKTLASVNSGDADIAIEAVDINVDNTQLSAQVVASGTAKVNLYGAGRIVTPGVEIYQGEINISGTSMVSAEVQAAGGHAEVNLMTGDVNPFSIPAGVKVSGGDINITGTSFVGSQTNGLAVGTSLVTFLASHDLNTGVDTTVSASVLGYDTAYVLGVAANMINAQGRVEAISSDYYAGVALLAMSDVLAGNVYASGQAGYVGDSIIEKMVENISGGRFDLVAQYDPAGMIFLASVYGDVILGAVESEMVLAAALGISGYNLDPIADLIQTGSASQDIDDFIVSEAAADSSIVNVSGDVSADFAYFLAKNNIGSEDSPIASDIGIVAGYSYGTGDVFIDQVTDKTLQVGLYLTLPDGVFTGASLAAKNGIVSVTSDTDIIINSVLTANGGVYMHSAKGSIYAGTGWDPSLYHKNLSDVSASLMTSLFDSTKYFSPIAYGLISASTFNYNLIAAGYSYLSTPVGTIGVGTQAGKDADNSGQVYGYVNPLITTVNADQGIGLDLRFGVPPGYVVYDDGIIGGVQVWPEIVAGDLGAQSFVNPLLVYVDVAAGAKSAVPEGFPEGTDPLAGLTLQIGDELPPTPTPDPEEDVEVQAPYVATEYLRAYYELLDRYRVTAMQPIVPTEYYAYHPVGGTDLTAFDQIQLDEGAYEFIDGNLNTNNPLAPYFGEEEKKR